MRIIANERYIERRAKAGRYLSLAGLLVLLAAFVFSWFQLRSPTLMPLALGAALTIGVILSYLGGYYMEQFGGPTAHYKGVRNALKGLDNRYTLLQYVLPVPHVLLGPDGLTVFAVRSQPGEVTYADGKWSHYQRGKFFRELAGQERLGRPELDAEAQVEQMKRYLEKHLPGTEVPIQGVVLFINPDVRLDLKDPPVPVFHSKKVKSWLRGPGARKNLPVEVRQQLEEVLIKE
ncbi:MAG TPA: NERD domain-containing protein [Chloroflexi bacterium]|nr:NERD domain-containing protein [Chloroflexota bacterium]